MTQQYNNTPLPAAYYPAMPVMVAPTIALTIVITLLFGFFGAIPAASGSSKAKALGQDSRKYWTAFWYVIAAQVAFGLVLVIAADAGA